MYICKLLKKSFVDEEPISRHHPSHCYFQRPGINHLVRFGHLSIRPPREIREILKVFAWPNHNPHSLLALLQKPRISSPPVQTHFTPCESSVQATHAAAGPLPIQARYVL